MRFKNIITTAGTLFAATMLIAATGCAAPKKTSRPARIAPAPVQKPRAETLREITEKAYRGDKDAQKKLAARYAAGNEVVKDEILSEQWNLRADPKLSAGAASVAKPVTAKQPAKTMASTAPLAAKTVPANAQKTAATGTKTARAAAGTPTNDFQLLLRRAAQGDRAALSKFRTDAALRKRLADYAKTQEGKRNPFVREVISRLNANK